MEYVVDILTNYIYKFLYLLVQSYIGAFVFILIGIYTIKDTIKETKKENRSFYLDIKGWIAGVGSIGLGLFIIIAKIIG
jgi:putative Mn2+ efflux pump MntP